MSSIEEKLTRATLDPFATLQYDGMTIPLIAKKNMILFLKYNRRARYISDASKQARQALVDFLIDFMNEGEVADVIKDIPEALYIPIIYAPIEMLVTNASKHEVDDMNQYLDQMLAFTWETLSPEKTAGLPA